MTAAEPVPLEVRRLANADAAAAEALLVARLAGRMQARRGELIDVLALPGFVAFAAVGGGSSDAPALVGVATFAVRGAECELVAIAARERFGGVGSALLSALVAEARLHACTRLWLITTNDNLDALRFYQRRGFRIRTVYPARWPTPAARSSPRSPSWAPTASHSATNWS